MLDACLTDLFKGSGQKAAALSEQPGSLSRRLRPDPEQHLGANRSNGPPESQSQAGGEIETAFR